MPPPQKEKDHDSYGEDSFEKYSDDEFESDDDKKDIKRALKHENKRAMRFQAKNVLKTNGKSSNVLTNNSFSKSNMVMTGDGSDHSRSNSREDNRPNLKGAEGGFAKSRFIVVNKQKVNYETSNKQYERTDALKEIIQIDFEEFDNQLNIKPQTAQDLYFNKLQTFQIHNEMVQSNDHYVAKDVQTDEIEERNVAIQFPEDFNEKSSDSNISRTNDLADFMRRVTPVVEMVLEENIMLADLVNPKAKEKNPVEEKSKISCPTDLLKALKAKISHISCTHSFETAPNRMCAVSYALENEGGQMLYITLVYHLSTGMAIKYLQTFNEVTCITTPFENIVICGTKLGSICLFDLDENMVYRGDISKDEPVLGDSPIQNFEEEVLKRKYLIQEPTYSTDGLDNFVHFNEITKLVSLIKKGSYRVVALDSIGTLSSWILIEYSEGDFAGSLVDLTLKVGGKTKLALHGSVDLSDKLGIIYDSETFEIDFDPQDHNTFIFSTSEGLFYSKLYNQSDDSTSIKGGPVVRKLDTTSVGELIRATSISYSDQGYILVGFEEGSVGLYHVNFSSPLSIWFNACETGVQSISWCSIYFTEGKSKLTGLTDNKVEIENSAVDSRFASRLCEFFIIDMNENFYIWNLNKDIHKSIHKINFADKHGGGTAEALRKCIISKTCPDQSFYTGFTTKDNIVVFYFMNFKKGTKISKDKIESENKKTMKLLKILPSNAAGG